MIIITEEVKYLLKMGKPLNSTFKKDNYFYLQRKDDVLMVNIEGCITTHPIGFLNNKDYLINCSFNEFVEALNTTMFNMNLFIYKTK